MSADLFIHLFEGITERDIAIMEKNTFGSKYFNPGKLGDEWDRAIEKIGKTEQIKVGEVSWLKALITDSSEFIPDPVAEIVKIIGEDLPTVDENLICKIKSALILKNKTNYSVANAKDIIDWLMARKGKRVFVVTW